MKTDRFTQTVLTVGAYMELAYFELYLARGNFAALYEAVRAHPVAKRTPDVLAPEDVSRAVDLACVFYPKEASCLQRSAAITCLLRRRGVRAQLVLGAQLMPFKSHAWVEVDELVVNDKPYMHEIYGVLDRC
jgi:transglutaminase superfamily protein